MMMERERAKEKKEKQKKKKEKKKKKKKMQNKRNKEETNEKHVIGQPQSRLEKALTMYFASFFSLSSLSKS